MSTTLMLSTASHCQGGQPWPIASLTPMTGGPSVTSRRRASPSGASAQGEYRRRRATERARWTRGLPWRAGAVLAVGVAVGLLGAQLAPELAALLAVAAAAGLGWRLRFRPSADTLAWRRGATGERRTARLLAPLERHGWAVLHDLAIPAPRPTSTTWSSAPVGCW